MSKRKDSVAEILRLEIPDVPPSPNRVLGKHWSTKAGEKDKWIMWIRSQILPEQRAWVKMRCVITLHHSRLYDRDNAYAAVKPAVDALKAWRLIVNDDEKWLELSVEQAKCPHKQRHTVIELEAA